MLKRENDSSGPSFGRWYVHLFVSSAPHREADVTHLTQSSSLGVGDADCRSCDWCPAVSVLLLTMFLIHTPCWRWWRSGASCAGCSGWLSSAGLDTDQSSCRGNRPTLSSAFCGCSFFGATSGCGLLTLLLDQGYNNVLGTTVVLLVALEGVRVVCPQSAVCRSWHIHNFPSVKSWSSNSLIQKQSTEKRRPTT